MKFTYDADPFPVRFKRTLLMLGSLAIAGAIVALAMFGAEALGYSREAGVVAVAVLATDILVFRWLFARVDVPPPKPFREAEK